MPKICVIGNESAYVTMFMRNGWIVVEDPEDADAIQFTGGEDVSPMLYGEVRHPSTGNNPRRDDYEANIFYRYVGEKAMLGICRGGQFLCVMNGHALWQDVDNHCGNHLVLDYDTNTEIEVSSTHHQMFRAVGSAGNEMNVLAIADNLAKTKETGDTWQEGKYSQDLEAIHFPTTNTLCFQPHPEFFRETHECQILYFRYIKDHCGLSA